MAAVGSMAVRVDVVQCGWWASNNVGRPRVGNGQLRFGQALHESAATGAWLSP